MHTHTFTLTPSHPHTLTVWYISSEPQSAQGDVLPRTQVSFAGSQSAAVDNGVIFLNGAPFANVSESIALAEAKGEDPADNELFFEPGRLLFNSLELCNFVHRCTIVRTSPTVVISEFLISLSLSLSLPLSILLVSA